MPSHEFPLFCARCSAELMPGEGNLYLIKIEAVADPTPPAVSEQDLQKDHRREIEHLLERMREMSGQELMDQVYRRMTVYLCGPCYREWIENPAGG